MSFVTEFEDLARKLGGDLRADLERVVGMARDEGAKVVSDVQADAVVLKADLAQQYADVKALVEQDLAEASPAIRKFVSVTLARIESAIGVAPSA